MQAYQRVAESDTSTVAQRATGSRFRFAQQDLLADGRLRVAVLAPNGLVDSVHYVAPDGTETAER